MTTLEDPAERMIASVGTDPAERMIASVGTDPAERMIASVSTDPAERMIASVSTTAVHVKTPVIIETSRYMIGGFVHVPQAMRLSDYMRSVAEFVSVTDATLSPIDDRERVRRARFVMVARSEITVVLPGWD